MFESHCRCGSITLKEHMLWKAHIIYFIEKREFSTCIEKSSFIPNLPVTHVYFKQMQIVRKAEKTQRSVLASYRRFSPMKWAIASVGFSSSHIRVSSELGLASASPTVNNLRLLPLLSSSHCLAQPRSELLLRCDSHLYIMVSPLVPV